jgi:(S)-ureidoglycine-glyoxylate aminotransferase
MSVADLSVPSRLLAGGGPSSPDARVLAALTTSVIGQFDPDFTRIMDEVMDLARRTFMTRNSRCYPVSALAQGGLEALINTIVEPGDRVAVGGGPRFVSETSAIARRYGAEVLPIDELGQVHTRLVVVPLVDPTLGTTLPIENLATACHAQGARLIVEATLGLGCTELGVDAWKVDACVAGVDYAIGAPSGMTFLTYSSDVEALMLARKTPPCTSYLDLLQLQAYWSPERLNHHTAPTSLVYGLREALRLVHDEGLPARWERHRRVGQTLHEGLTSLGLDVHGEPPYALVRLAEHADESALREALLDQFGVHVRLIDQHTWRIGRLGEQARPDAANRVLTSIEKLLEQR